MQLSSMEQQEKEKSAISSTLTQWFPVTWNFSSILSLEKFFQIYLGMEVHCELLFICRRGNEQNEMIEVLLNFFTFRVINICFVSTQFVLWQ